MRMKMKMSSDFKSRWDDVPTYPDVTRFVLKDKRFFISRHISGAALLIVHEDEENSFVQLEDIFSGLTIYQDQSVSGFRINCRLDDVNLERKFSYVCEDIVKDAYQYSGEDLYNHLVNQLKQWSGFLRPKREGLSDEKYLGLWGELWVIAKHYLGRFDADTVAHSYNGPEGSSQDISGLDFTLEVKSTYSKSPKELNISSLEQLDASCEYQGICLLRVDKAENGESIETLVMTIEKYLSSDDDALMLFRRKSSQLLGDASLKQMSTKNVTLQESCWKVTPDFPALKRSEIPVEITKANYKITLAGIQDFEIPNGIGGYLDAI